MSTANLPFVLHTGYFLYDFLDLALNGKMFAMWEVQVHHVAVSTVSTVLGRDDLTGFLLIN